MNCIIIKNFRITWTQSISKLLEEVGDSYGCYNYRESDQLHWKVEEWLILTDHHHKCQKAATKQQEYSRQLHYVVDLRYSLIINYYYYYKS